MCNVALPRRSVQLSVGALPLVRPSAEGRSPNQGQSHAFTSGAEAAAISGDEHSDPAEAAARFSADTGNDVSWRSGSNINTCSESRDTQMMKTLNDTEARELFKSARVVRLGCILNGEPYVVPI